MDQSLKNKPPPNNKHISHADGEKGIFGKQVIL